MMQVEMENVTKVYPRSIVAVDHLDLGIDKGELVVLVGPSGCGKTTILRMIAGLEAVSAGIIRIGGKTVNDVPPRDRDVAMVFQNYALYPHMSVYKNMAFALKIRKYAPGQIERLVRETAQRLGIEDLLPRNPHTLSGGQRQQVALARAMVRQPQVFLFDEPLSNLDAQLRLTLRAQLKRWQVQMRTSVLYVTHDQEEAMALGERIVVLRAGQIQQIGPPLELYHRPANRFVAGFIGTPPMNFLSGQLALQNGNLFFQAGMIRLNLGKIFPHAGKKLAGDMVTLGIRPEALCMRDEEQLEGKGNILRVRIDVVEVLGEKMDLYGQCEVGQSIIARVEPQAGIRVGEWINLYVNQQKIHLFNTNEAGMSLRA
jgi:multiple sugar transport system ATP-binding protein